MSEKKLIKIFDSPFGLDEMEKADKEYNNKMGKINAQLNQDYASCFGTDTGQRVLKHLEKCTLSQPTWIPEAGTEWSYAREGQNSMVRNILLRIKNAKKK